jgi:hypothetical protein
MLVAPGINATHGRRISKTVSLELLCTSIFFSINSIRSERNHFPGADFGI